MPTSVLGFFLSFWETRPTTDQIWHPSTFILEASDSIAFRSLVGFHLYNDLRHKTSFCFWVRAGQICDDGSAQTGKIILRFCALLGRPFRDGGSDRNVDVEADSCKYVDPILHYVTVQSSTLLGKPCVFYCACACVRPARTYSFRQSPL